MMKAQLIVLLFSIDLTYGLISKSENIILERPDKPSKGTLEKPDYEHVEHESTDDVDTGDSSWIRDVWKNAFGSRSGSESGEASGGFFSSLHPWWKGPNVCKLEEEYTSPVNGGNIGSFSLFNFLMTSCHESRRAYKCTKRTKFNDTAVRVQSLTYECCLGYERDPENPSGCQKKVELRDLLTTLRDLNATKLAEALREANLDSVLGQGNITLIAPSDDAMTNSDGQNDISVVVLESSDKLQFPRDILNGHVISGSKYYSSDDFEDEMVLKTLSDGASIRINIFPRPVPFATANCARITSIDNQMTNGYIHVINRLLTPVQRSLWGMIENDQKYSIMRSLVDDNLKRLLDDPNQHMTLLAFTNDAFEKLPEDVRQRIQSKSECFKNLLLHHLIPHTICSAAIYNDQGYVRNVAGRLINATRAEDGTLAFAGQKVSKVDQMTTNGVLHEIDGLILSPEMLDVVTALERRGDEASIQFSSLLKSNDLAPTLSSSPGVTVFVPPSDSSPSLSRDDVRNHVLRQTIIDSGRFTVDRPTTFTTEAGSNITVGFKYDFPSLFSWNGGRVLRLHVGCSSAERVVRSCNGAIVYLDKPLYAPTKTVYDLLKSKDELSEFVSMIDAANLSSDLQDPAFSGTVLAPSNEALSQYLRASEKEALMKSPQRLKQFLKQHMLMNTRCCDDFSGNSWFAPSRLPTMAGTRLTATGFEGRDLAVGGAAVKECNLGATNGLVHVIDGVVISRRWSQVPSFFSRYRDLLRHF